VRKAFRDPLCTAKREEAEGRRLLPDFEVDIGQQATPGFSMAPPATLPAATPGRVVSEEEVFGAQRYPK